MNNARLKSYHNTCLYTESANTGHKDIPSIHLHQSKEQLHGCIPQASSVAQRWRLSLRPWVLLFLDVYKAMLRLHLTSLPRHKTSLPCKVSCVSGTPAPSLPTPSCTWTFFPSVPDHFFVSNYRC